KVANVGAILEAQSRAVKVRVVLPNADGRLKPGMFATVQLSGSRSGQSSTGLYVPEGAVQRDDGVPIVFLSAGPGRFRHVRVRTGRERPGWVEVVSGVAAGDSVVTEGAFLLKSELRKSELGEEE
ncbi:MAG: efflux RND transporter periplasmic adaptor subunit, partial [Gemmatimonadetes bacterium]|nr:efflux RND transporter periplasmic adaptor subunit [Gemmatimonadota bacterium]